MHILFVDESGTCPRPGSTQNRYFVIGGVIVPEDQWHSIREEILEIILQHRTVRCLACVASAVGAYKLRSIETADDLYLGTYKPISERFQYFLQDESRAVGKPQYGIVVSDHRGATDDKRFRLHHQKLLHASAEFISRYDNFVESLFVQPSNMSVGIQLADIVAGSVWRSFERNDDRWIEELRPAFRASRTGVIDGFGLVKFPKQGWV